MKYRIIITDEAERDIELLGKSGGKKIISKINSLYLELQEHPRTGTGKPKPLKHEYLGYYSRRITKKHRLIYSINDTEIIVLVVSAMGHYKDK